MSTQLNKDEFDLDGFLAEREFENDAEKEVVRKFFERKKNQAAVLAQSEFSKRMDGLTAQERDNAAKLQKAMDDLSTKQKSLDDLITRNIAYKGDADKAVEKAQRELEKAEAKAKKAAKAAGYDLDELEIDDDELAPTRKRMEPIIDIEKLKKELGVDRHIDSEQLERLATGHINLTLELDEIKDTYQDLHGKRMTRQQKEELLQAYNDDAATFLRKHPNLPPPPLETTAARLFKFDEKRGEMAAADKKKFEEEIRADERKKMERERLDQDLPGPRRTDVASPLWTKTRKEGEKPTEGRGVRLAMEELNKRRSA